VNNNFLLRIIYWIVVGGGSGFLYAPGTMGTLLIGVPLVWFVNAAHGNAYVNWLIVGLTTGLVERMLAVTEPFFQGIDDPPCINIDEALGFLWAMHGLPLSVRSFVISFLLFRLFDITKIGGIDAVQRIGGAWGILADDILAGLYTRFIMIMFFI